MAVQYGIKNFETLLEFPNLRNLFLPEVNPQKLDIVSRLTQLEQLEISSMRSVTSLEPLASLRNLQLLSLGISFKEFDLEPLGQLTNLRILAIAISMGSGVNGGKAFCPTFAPLANLQDLEYLELFAIKPRDNTLQPISKCKKLKLLDICNMYSLEDYACLAASLPNAEGLFQTPYYQPTRDDFICNKCGCRDEYILFGVKRRTSICAKCEKHKLYEHIARFEQLKLKYRMVKDE